MDSTTSSALSITPKTSFQNLTPATQNRKQPITKPPGINKIIRKFNQKILFA